MVVLRVFQLEVFIGSVRLRWLPSSSCPRRCFPSSLEPIPAVAVVPATVRWSFNSVDRHCPSFATNFPSRRRRRQLFSILSWFFYPGIIPTSSRWQLVRCAVYTNNPPNRAVSSGKCNHRRLQQTSSAVTDWLNFPVTLLSYSARLKCPSDEDMLPRRTVTSRPSSANSMSSVRSLDLFFYCPTHPISSLTGFNILLINRPSRRQHMSCVSAFSCPDCRW